MIQKHPHSFCVDYGDSTYHTKYFLISQLVDEGLSFEEIAYKAYSDCKYPYTALQNCLNYIYACHPHLMYGVNRPVKTTPTKSKVTIKVTSENLDKALKNKLTKAEEKAFTAKFKALSPKQRLKLFKKML